MSEITLILTALGADESASTAKLVPLVYDELRRLASQKLQGDLAGHSLQATALVHEVFLRLASTAPSPRNADSLDHDSLTAVWENRAHFFGAASEAMRRILVDAARSRTAQKRGGDWQQTDHDLLQIESPTNDSELIAVNDVLDRLAEIDPDAAQLVKLRFFGGMNMSEIANALQISVRTAHNTWSYARAWLRHELGDQSELNR